MAGTRLALKTPDSIKHYIFEDVSWHFILLALSSATWLEVNVSSGLRAGIQVESYVHVQEGIPI